MAIRRFSWGLLVFLAAIGFQFQATAQTPSGLTRLLQAELARFPAKTGVYVKNLKTGEEAMVRADDAFNSASVIKLAVLGLAYNMADRKELNLEDRVEITRANIRLGSGILQYHIGLKPSLRDVLTEMVITSDNTATEIMIGKVGGKARVNAWLAQIGLTHTKLQKDQLVFTDVYGLFDPRWKTLTAEESVGLDLGINNDPRFEMYRALFSGEKAGWIADGKKMDGPATAAKVRQWTIDPQYWLGSMTPRETGQILERIENGTLASKQSCDEMRVTLKRQLSGASRIPHFLTADVGHKTGDLPPFVANDVGIVYASSGPIVISFFTAESTEPLYGELEDHIGRAAQLIVAYFEGGSKAGAN